MPSVHRVRRTKTPGGRLSVPETNHLLGLPTILIQCKAPVNQTLSSITNPQSHPMLWPSTIIYIPVDKDRQRHSSPK